MHNLQNKVFNKLLSLNFFYFLQSGRTIHAKFIKTGSTQAELK